MDRQRYDALVRSLYDPASPAVAAALAGVRPHLDGTDDGFNPIHLASLRGPATALSLAGAVACLGKNPNLCTGSDGQGALAAEAAAVEKLTTIVWPGAIGVGGVFTSGGSTSNLYAARTGLEKAVPGAMRRGLRGEAVAGVCSEAAHHSVATAAGWLGLGTDHLHRVPTDPTCAMRLDLLAAKLSALYRDGVRVAFVVATAGTTDAGGWDDVAAAREVIDRTAGEHNQPTPHLHADAAVGWQMGFLTGYDTTTDPLGFGPMLPLVERVQRRCRGLLAADSVTVDFHKGGLGHYPGSAILIRRRADLDLLARADHPPYLGDADDPVRYTLETSRPGLGPYSVLASLAGLGRDDWRLLVARSLELADYFKARLAGLPHCRVLNPNTAGPGVVFWVLPRGTDANALFARLASNELPAAEMERCRAEVRRLFDARQRAIGPADVRLGFTADIGFRPHGHRLPAWRAVFLNPLADEAVIDRLVAGLDRLA